MLLCSIPQNGKVLLRTLPFFFLSKIVFLNGPMEKSLTMHRMQTMQGKTRLSRRCAKSVQKCAEPQKKENPTRNLTIPRGILVRSRELESLALWLKEPTGQVTLILKLSSFRYFCAKHRDFSLFNFCTLCRILQVRVPIASLETVQKQCRNRALTLGQIKKWWFFIHDLVAIWVTTKVNLVHGKKNAHSSEKFSGEWAVLRRRLI